MTGRWSSCAGSRTSPLELVTTSMYPLHFGDFFGIGLKVVYFTFPPSATSPA